MSLKKRSDGQYVARYYEDGTKQSPYRRRVLGRDYEKAKRAYARLLAEAQERRVRASQPAAALTFAALATLYLEFRGPQLAPKSLQRAKGVIATYGEKIGPKLVTELEPLDILGVQQGRKVSPASLNREWHVIRAILNWGRKKKGLPNPLAGRIEPQRLADGGAKVDYFEAHEWRAFIAVFADRDAWKRAIGRKRVLGPVKGNTRAARKPRRFGGGRNPDSEASAERITRLVGMGPIFSALLFTGARLGDVLALRWQDADFRAGTLRIGGSKGKQFYVIPMSDALRGLLQGLPRGVRDAHIFRRGDGQPFSVIEVQRAFRLAREIAGLRSSLTPHLLRHTLGSWLAQSGESLLTIQKLLGHSDPAITARHYAHLQPQHSKSAVDRIAEIASGNLPATFEKRD